MDKTSIKREYKPKEWKIVSGDPIECIDVEELDAHNVSLIKHRNYDGNGVPYRTLVNFNFKNGDLKRLYRITEVLTYVPTIWADKTKSKFGEGEYEPYYETWIEIIDDETGRSEVFKLADGVRLHNDIVSNEIHKVLDRQNALDDFEFEF